MQYKVNILFPFSKPTTGYPQNSLKYIRDGLYELRMEYNSNIYRVFFIFDNDNIVVLFNGFHKKTQKTPVGEIEKH
ncbi:MAG: type II toxin-antitoxin system RelE/ParE family toxin [Tannerella sp.]|nr:type II toxin-antitoxin system RelE/ParE family toxin [Tannerella sp.]